MLRNGGRFASESMPISVVYTRGLSQHADYKLRIKRWRVFYRVMEEAVIDSDRVCPASQQRPRMSQLANSVPWFVRIGCCWSQDCSGRAAQLPNSSPRSFHQRPLLIGLTALARKGGSKKV